MTLVLHLPSLATLLTFLAGAVFAGVVLLVLFAWWMSKWRFWS